MSRSGIDVAARDHADDLAAAGAAGERGGDGAGARPFRDDAGAFGELAAMRRSDLVECRDQRAVQELPARAPASAGTRDRLPMPSTNVGR